MADGSPITYGFRRFSSWWALTSDCFKDAGGRLVFLSPRTHIYLHEASQLFAQPADITLARDINKLPAALRKDAGRGDWIKGIG